MPDFDFTNEMSALLSEPSVVTSERKFEPPTVWPDRDLVWLMSAELTEPSPVVRPAVNQIAGTSRQPLFRYFLQSRCRIKGCSDLHWRRCNGYARVRAQNVAAASSATRTFAPSLVWCARERVPLALITHCGSEIVPGHERKLAKELHDLAVAPGIEAFLARDGLRLEVK